MTILAAATASRKSADTPVPINPPTSLKFSNFDCNAFIASGRKIDATTTTVECPSEKNRPTEIGRLPVCISLRVTLSIAAM